MTATKFGLKKSKNNRRRIHIELSVAKSATYYFYDKLVRRLVLSTKDLCQSGDG